MQWKGDPAMSKYLCPDTLYRPSKFEKYLQEAKRHFPHIELDVEEKIFSEETEDAVERWKLLYPGLDVNGELLDVLEWTLECPKERPKDWFLFLDARMKQASVRPIKQVHARLA